jgi:ribosomal protein S27E
MPLCAYHSFCQLNQLTGLSLFLYSYTIQTGPMNGSYAYIIQQGIRMKLSCNQLCRMKEFFANLKCPKCFSTRVTLCEEEAEENAACEACGCEFTFNPELPQGGME